MHRSALLALALALVAAGCGGSSAAGTTSSSEAASSSVASGPAFAAPMVANPPKLAADFTLRDYTGKTVTLSKLRGKAVMITFVYSHCPDVCQVILNALASARRHLPPADAKRFQIVAISVDPKGDTPAAVKRFLDARLLIGKADYLIGTRAELGPVWASYGIQVQPGDASAPDLLAHTSIIYGIDAAGKVRVLFPADPLDPAGIAHDVKLLVHAA